MNFANYDYNKEKDLRDYNYKLARDKIEDERYEREFALAQQKKTSSGGSSGGSKKSSNTLSANGQKLYNEYMNRLSYQNNGGVTGKFNAIANSVLTNENAMRSNIYNQVGKTISDNDAKILFNLLGL